MSKKKLITFLSPLARVYSIQTPCPIFASLCINSQRSVFSSNYTRMDTILQKQRNRHINSSPVAFYSSSPRFSHLPSSSGVLNSTSTFSSTNPPVTLQDPHPGKESDVITPPEKGDFRLTEKFLSKYRDAIPPFGFNGLGEIVYRRTYSRLKVNGEREQWWETVERVVNGTFNMQKRHIESLRLPWDIYKAQANAQAMYDRIFNMKFLPPGRGLWAMGSPLTEERGMFAALNNCAFVSTGGMWEGKGDRARPFTFLMDAAMLGVGVGFDTRGAAVAKAKNHIVCAPNDSKPPVVYQIEDSREGWVKSVGLLIESYLRRNIPIQEYDYSLIRPAGSPIKGFGGVSSGPQPLANLHMSIREILGRNINKPLSVTSIVDLMNVIGKCVIAGNVRRTAEIAFGDPNDDEYVDLKNYKVNPNRAAFGWTSNNSVFAELGMDYSNITERIRSNGEPGFFWLSNAQRFSRMNGFPDNKDIRAQGGNPCLEQTLESYELCCLVETFPNNHTTKEDFLETLKHAFLYAKTVTLGATHWKESNAVMLRNRRIGTGLSGVAQFVSQRGIDTLREWCEDGYAMIQKTDREISEWFCVPKSIKTTTIKPSGTVSLLAGATPGMHYPESRYCIRRVRLSRYSDLIDPLRRIGYKLEQDVVEPNTMVVEIPIDHGEGVRSLRDVSMWEQLSLAAFLQSRWSDNQVSCTVTFDPETESSHLAHALDYFQYHLKGISFLPRLPTGAYPQMPIEAITPEHYNLVINAIKSKLPAPSVPKPPPRSSIPGQLRPIKFSSDAEVKVDLRAIRSTEKVDPEMEKFCDSTSCVVIEGPTVKGTENA